MPYHALAGRKRPLQTLPHVRKAHPIDLTGAGNTNAGQRRPLSQILEHAILYQAPYLKRCLFLAFTDRTSLLSGNRPLEGPPTTTPHGESEREQH